MGVKKRRGCTSSKPMLTNLLPPQRSSIWLIAHRQSLLSDMFRKIWMVSVITLLLADAGNPINLRGKKGKNSNFEQYVAYIYIYIYTVIL